MIREIIRLTATQQLLRRLDKRGPINPYAVAFLLTESSFRGPVFRLVEFCYSIFVIYLMRREPKVTLGRTQVLFPYWRLRYGDDSYSLLLATWSDVASYEICCLYLKSKNPRTIKEMLISYNGRPSKIYVQRFVENLDVVKDSIQQLRLRIIAPLLTS